MLEPGSLAPLVEAAPGIAAERTEEVAAAFAADDGLEWVALLDERGRPGGLLSREAWERGEAPSAELLVVGVTNGLVEVAQRALLRPPRTRFEPLVCCDAGGGYAGLVPFERLVEALMRAADLPPG
jgi:hypothetical protein